MEDKHTIDWLLASAQRRLAGGAAPETARLDAELLLGHALGVGRATLRTFAERTPGTAELERFEYSLERRIRGEPLAYVLGYKDFWTLRLAVTPAVLVPRPETELVVERALALSNGPRAADLGTGSGAIALALASERRQWQVVGTDASAGALAVARGNAAALHLDRVEFVSGSWFEPLAGRTFDLVVSNPPYIAAADPALRHPVLQHEPLRALTPGSDGLADLRAIIREAPLHLTPGGWMVLEHGADQAPEVAHELVSRGFHHVTSRRDLAGHERVTEAQWL